MSTHDYVIDNQSATSFRADLNAALAAIVTQNSNATAPTTTFANMLWYDTATNILKKRNEANSAWISLGTIDETAGTFTPSGERALASQAQAEAGTDNATLMTPLRVSQAVAALSLPHTLLGTINTTSGASQTLSGLNLTGYKFILLMVNGMSHSLGAFYLTSVMTSRTFATAGSGGAEISGSVLIDLSTGVFSSSCAATSGTVTNYAGLSGISSASTSVTVLSANTFDLGSIKVYGVK